MKTTLDSEKLGQHIEELNLLRETWNNKIYQITDAEENGGSTVINIEEMEQVIIDMKTAFIQIIDQTIAYMNNRKEAIAEIESQAIEATKGGKSSANANMTHRAEIK